MTLITAHLVLLEPLLNEMFLALGQHWPTQLKSLVLVELTALQQDAKVLEEGGLLSRRGGHCLESLDSLRSTQDTLKEEEEEDKGEEGRGPTRGGGEEGYEEGRITTALIWMTHLITLGAVAAALAAS